MAKKENIYQSLAGEFERMSTGEMRHIKTSEGLFTVKKGVKQEPTLLKSMDIKNKARVVKGSKI